MLADIGISTFAPMGSALRPYGVDETLDLMQGHGLRLSSYHSNLRLLEMSDGAADAALMLNLDIAVRLGATVMSVSPGPSGVLSSTHADRLFIDRLARAAPLAQATGIRLAVEPLHPFLRAHGYIHGFAHGLDVVSQVPGCGLMLDLVQIYWDRTLLDNVAAHVQDIAVVQLGNLDAAALNEKRWQRTALDRGDIDVARTVRALLDAGYQGYFELENPLDLPPVECIGAVRDAYSWFIGL